MSHSPTPEERAALFQKSWTLYDTITAKNYMFHRELYARVGGVLRDRHGRGPYSLLDLGCGNARFLGACLREAPPVSYHGVDLSAPALEEVPHHIPTVCATTLDQRDLLEATENAPGTFDIIFSGFAVHHLDSDAKQRLFHAVAAHLAPGGGFVMVDVAREEAQPRDVYLAEYLALMRTTWTDIPPELLEEACEHVASFDQPETVPTLARMAAEAGLPNARLIERRGAHHLIRFSAE